MPDQELKTKLFFKDNFVTALYSEGEGPGSTASNFIVSLDGDGQRWGYRLKSQMIPAQTYGMGGHVVNALNVPGQPLRNIDMNTLHRTGNPVAWPADRLAEQSIDWRHSDARNVAYLYTHKMFDDLLTKGDLK